VRRGFRKLASLILGWVRGVKALGGLLLNQLMMLWTLPRLGSGNEEFVKT